MESNAGNGENEGDQNTEDVEVYLKFLDELITKLHSGDPVKNGLRITQLSNIVKALRGVGVSQSIVNSAKEFVKRLHTAFSGSSSTSEDPRPSTSAATSNNNVDAKAATISGVSSETVVESATSAAVSDSGKESSEEVADSGAELQTCTTAAEESIENISPIAAVEESDANVTEQPARIVSTEEIVENVTEQPTLTAVVEENVDNVKELPAPTAPVENRGFRVRRISSASESDKPNTQTPNKDLDGIGVAASPGCAQICPEMNKWSTPEKIDIISPPARDDGSVNEFFAGVSPSVRDCQSPPSDLDAIDSKSGKHKSRLSTLVKMPWQLHIVDGIPPKQTSAQRQPSSNNLDPRCSGYANPSSDTPKEVPEPNSALDTTPKPNFDATSLASLLNWVKEKNERGEPVPIPTSSTVAVPENTNIDAVPVPVPVPSSTSVDSIAVSSAEPSTNGNSKQSDDDECVITGFYRESRPFHLLHSGEEPVIPPGFLPKPLKMESGVDGKPLGGPSSFPPGNHIFPRPTDDDLAIVDKDEERVSTGPRLVRRKIHDRYDQIADDWARRGEKAKIEEMEQRRLREQLDRERSEKERLERLLKQANEMERARQKQQEAAVRKQQIDAAARSNHNFANPHNVYAHHCGPNQQPLPYQLCNPLVPNQYPYQQMPPQQMLPQLMPPQHMMQPLMPMPPHGQFPISYAQPPMPHGQAINPAYANNPGVMLNHHAPPIPSSGLHSMSQFPQTPARPPLPLNPHTAATFANPNHTASTVASRNGLTIAQLNEKNPCSSASQMSSTSNEPLIPCKHCEYVGTNFELVAHHVNRHPKKFVPIKLPLSELKEAKKELEKATSASSGRQETGIRCLDDLSWIPTGSMFMDEQTCRICPHKGRIRSSFVQHVQKHRADALARMPKPSPAEPVFNCRFCDETFTEINPFYTHVTGHTGEFAFKCSKCNYRGQTRIIVKVHISQDHRSGSAAILPTQYRRVTDDSSLSGFGCSLCGYVQLDKDKMELHISQKHRKGSANAIKINMSRSSKAPRAAAKEQLPSTSNKVSSRDPRSAPKEIAVPRRAPPVKVKGDPRTTADRATVKDLATPPMQPKKTNRAATHKPSPRSPKSQSMPNTSPKASRPEDNLAKSLRTYSIPKKSATKPTADALPSLTDRRRSSSQSETDDGRSADDTSSVPQPSGMRQPKEAVIVEDTSQFSSKIFIKSDGETVGLLTMEVEIGEVTNPTVDEDEEPEDISSVRVKWEKDDDDNNGMDLGSVPSNDVIAPLSRMDNIGPCSNLAEAGPPPSRVEVAPPSSRDEVAKPSSRDEVAQPSSRVEVAPPASGAEAEPPTSRDEVAPPTSRVEVTAPLDRVTPPANHDVLGSSQPGKVIKVERTSVDETGPVPSIAETILKLQVQLHQEPSGDSAPAITSPPAADPLSASPSVFYTNSCSQRIRISSRRLKDWNERRKVLICCCLFAARSTEAFTKHREHWHKGEKRTACPECSAKFDNATDYADHLWRTCPRSSMRIYACSVEPLCRFTTSSQLHFITHVKEDHAGIDWLPCYWCGKQYTTGDCLAAHLHNQCAIKIPMLRALQSNLANGTSSGSAVDRADTCSPEEPVAPHLEVVYRCYVANCRHESLEREVFIDHIQVVHPERKEHGCFHCESKFGSIYSLVLHMEEKHREDNSDSIGNPLVIDTPDLTPAPVASSSRRSTSDNVTDATCDAGNPRATQNPCDSAVVQVPARTVLPTPAPQPDSQPPAPPVENPAGGYVWSSTRKLQVILPKEFYILVLPPEENLPAIVWSSVRRMQVNELMRVLSLSYEIISTSKLDPAQHRENLAKWLEIHGPQKGRTLLAMKSCVDPIVFATKHKSQMAMRAILVNLEKLAHLYKCASKECTFTCSSENEFREHLLLDRCRIGHYLYCLYCGERHKTVRGAVSHVSQRHMLCIHQCPHCIYRTKNKGYLMFHIARVHPQDDEPMMRLMTCNGSRPLDLEDELPDLFSLSVPVACAVDGCTFVTIDPLPLVNHHRDVHGDLPSMSCFHCMESFPPHEIETHFQKHMIYNIQCRYCSYGTCVPPDIIVHLCNIHPNRTGRVVLRECSQLPPSPAPRVAQASSGPTPSQPQAVRIKQEPVDHNESENPVAGTSEETAIPALPSTGSETAESSLPPSTCGESSLPSVAPVPPVDPAATPSEPNRHSCGYQQCRYGTNRLRELTDHLVECARRYVDDPLYCKQCYSTFRNPTIFLEHLRSHLAKLFICGICKYTAHLPHYMKSHFRSEHNLSLKDTKCKLKIPDTDSLSDTPEYIYEPVVPKLVIRQDPTGLTSEVAPPTAAAKNAVAEDLEVDDVDSIPTQSIFARPLKCRRCPYSTQVRQNMIRHIEQCKRERATNKNATEADPGGESDGTTASTAASDNVNEDVNVNPSLRIWYPRYIPQYVKVKDRFRCCIGDCTRLEGSSAAYEAHITGDHADVLRLPCPHCGDEFAEISDFHLHIRLHGPNLFRCWYCTYHHYHRNLVSGHCLQQHHGVPPLVRTLRQEHEIDVPDNSLVSNWRRSQGESATTSREDARGGTADEGPMFVCKTCKKFKTSSESAMRAHLIEELDLETYSCSLCTFSCGKNTGIQEHFESSHNGEILDFRVSMDHRHEVLLNQLLEVQAESHRRPLSGRQSSVADDIDKGDGPSTLVYPCPKCAFAHPARSFARTHILCHLQKQNNKCKVCDGQFSRLQHLRRHHLNMHPDQPFVGHKSKDSQVEEFVDWVLKRLEDAAYENSDIPRPITITCQKNGCLMPFSDLKKFNEHFKKHVRSPAGSSESLSSPVKNTAAPARSADSIPTDDDDDKPWSARFELNCPFCKFTHRQKSNVRRHILRHYDYKFYLCGYCAQEGLEHKDVAYHCRDLHKDKPVEVIEKPRPETMQLRPVSNKPLIAVGLDQLGASSSTLEKNGKFQCGDCLFTTSGITYARYHCQNRHLKASILKIWCGDPNAVPDNQLPAPENEAAADVAEQRTRECTMCHEQLVGPQAYLDHIAEKHSAATNISGKDKRKKSKQPQPAAKRKATSGSRAAANGAPTDVVAYRCKSCGKQFREMGEVRTHFRVFHPTEELEYEDVLREEMYRCPRCTFASAFFEEAKRHVLRQHAEPFLCGLCGKGMWSHDAVLRHSRSKHRNEPTSVERNPSYKEQRSTLMRHLKQSPRRRRRDSGEAAAPTNVVEDDDEVTVIDIDDELEEPAAASSAPEVVDGESSRSPNSHVRDSPDSPVTELESPASPVPSCSGATLPQQPFTPSRSVARKSTAAPSINIGTQKRGKKRKAWEGETAVWNLKRINLAEHFPSGFSYYGFRSEKMDLSKLTVHTNFRGVRNAKMTFEHLCDVFNMFPKVVVVDCLNRAPKKTFAVVESSDEDENSGASPKQISGANLHVVL